MIDLNTVYEKMVAEGVSEQVLDEFARISYIAWHHLFFIGRYSFKKASKATTEFAAMTELLDKHLKQAFSTE